MGGFVAEKMLIEQQEMLVSESVSDMRQRELASLERLSALAKVNLNIRDIEITQQKALIEDMGSHLKCATFRLDAIRIILATD
ncbi:MAG: hypothetical protein A6F72_06465 [Cycloclasticus sp. symbiont of Poecilosclerida sp. N]|nr:MAG: hypothetical protein A6F72_06465 [Cycloclasticus sp. symbiont of Poecilosclerida sp. N]